MSPIGNGTLSLTKFYRLRVLVRELAAVRPGMTQEQVQNVLGAGHRELADDLVLYDDYGYAIDDPLLAACRSGSPAARVLIWVALVMSDYRLATVVETHLTDSRGKLVERNFNTDRLEEHLQSILPGISRRKPATNILSYFRDSEIVEPSTYTNTIVGIASTNSTAPHVPDVVDYIAFRLDHLGISPSTESDVDTALAVRANHWLNLTATEFSTAAGTAASTSTARPTAQPKQPPRPPSPAAASRASTTRRRADRPEAVEVAVEAQNMESFEVSVPVDPRVAVRREQPLVLAYKMWMEERESEIVRLRVLPEGSTAHLYCDVYDKTRNNLLEAKADTGRASIRMAIGQLMDYARFASPRPDLAVLTEDRPSSDLEALLSSLRIACVWRRGHDFVDNADGRFV